MNLNESKNILLFNPRSAQAEQDVFKELKVEFEKKYGAEGYFLIPSSGSAKKQNESVKLIALSRQALFNSAIRFNSYFQADKKMNWGLVLPEFHVGGLSVLMRAQLAEAQVFRTEWQIKDIFSWLQMHEIHFLSIVPTQVYDLVQHQIAATSHIKKVFVGGAALDAELKKKALQLGWPIIETYGMTETASMIAVSEDKDFLLLPGVQCEIENELLKIKCDSLMTTAIQKKEQSFVFFDLSPDGWLRTQDKAEIFQKNNKVFIKILGRQSDFIKINGEGVSLTRLKDILNQSATLSSIQIFQIELLPVVDSRAGNILCLAVENAVSKSLIKTLVDQFNEKVMPFERIKQIKYINQIPRTDLGKVSTELLKSELQKVEGLTND